MHKAEDYTYRVFWSEEDQSYIATVAEFPLMSSIEDTQQAAFIGMVDLVASVLEDMEEGGEVAPEPISKRRYSGKIALRMTPEQHQRIALEAAEQNVSINQLLVSRV